MADQESLFGDAPDDRTGDDPAPPLAPALAQWRIDMLRAALDKQGLTSMSERQSAVESIVGHELASLRELTVAEATTVLEELSAGRQGPAGSSWDERDEDTWIDRL